MNINEAYNFVQFLANQTQSGRIKPEDFNLNATRAQLQLFSKYRQAWQDTQIVTDALKTFLNPIPLSIPINGQLPYPTDYASTSSVRHIYFPNSSTAVSPKSIEVEVDELNDDEIGNVSSSQIVQPSRRYPKVAYYNTYMQFYPKNLGTALFTYFRFPVAPVWGFTLIGGVPTYNPATSVDFEFMDQYHNAIVMIICEFLGINIREADLIEAAELFKSENS